MAADTLAGGDMEGLSETGDGRERALKGRVNRQNHLSQIQASTGGVVWEVMLLQVRLWAQTA